MFSLHENLWPGDAPGPPNDISARHKEAARDGPSPRKPEAERRSRTIGVRARPDRRTGLPDPHRLRTRRSSRSPGRAKPVPPTGTYGWDPFRPPSVRGGEGTRPRREERTESVPEAGGTGAEAVVTQTRSLAGHFRGLTREADWRRPAVIGWRRENIRRPADQGGPADPQIRERRRSGILPGDRRGRSAPRQPRGYTGGMLACVHQSCRFPRDLHDRVTGKARAVERPQRRA